MMAIVGENMVRKTSSEPNIPGDSSFPCLLFVFCLLKSYKNTFVTIFAFCLFVSDVKIKILKFNLRHKILFKLQKRISFCCYIKISFQIENKKYL